ncbi:GntR family transcriptional regulator [Paracoccus sp. (in: a-proteobacteria)]|uniref:GntR family transcriptional regulator n=1 Tax=Paracoccus sp. TaxID=267 RepID=UPI0035B24FC6
MNENAEDILASAEGSGDAPTETLSIQVYHTIRDRIFRGEWFPGTRLTLRALAAELGTSVQPVRDAIGKLTVERVLVLRPNYSVQIPDIDRGLMDEIFAVRNILEAEAARRSVAVMTDADIDDLEEAIRATRRVYWVDTQIPSRVTTIQEVSRILAERCGSRTICEQLINLRARTAPYYAAALARNDDGQDEEFVTFTIRIQDEFVAALRRRDGVAAAEIRKVDLYTFQHYIYRLLGVE